MSGLADVSIHDVNRMAIYRETRKNSSVSARQIAVLCKRTLTLRQIREPKTWRSCQLSWSVKKCWESRDNVNNEKNDSRC